MAYTEKEMAEFRDLVEAGESRNQLERIRSRMDFPRFIERVGRDKCDEMFAALCAEGSNDQPSGD